MAGGHILNYTLSLVPHVPLEHIRQNLLSVWRRCICLSPDFPWPFSRAKVKKPYETSNVIQKPARELFRPRRAGKCARPCGPTVAGRYRLSSGRISVPVKDITVVILAGGRSQRMGGEDKGLVELAGKTMVDHVIERIRPQAGGVIINANRNLERYQAFGYPVVSDDIGDYAGPLAGMASAMRLAETDYLATVPCDSPLIPDNLVRRLYEVLIRDSADISVAYDGVRLQPVCALLRRSLLPSLLDYLHAGGRKIDLWYGQHHFVTADFSDTPDSFVNVNTPQEHSRIGSGISRRPR